MNAPADDIHDAAGAYALDALDDLERARFEAHLARCASCRQDVDDFRATAQLLGRAAADEPPPEMRAAVLTSIGQVRQDSPLPRLASRGRAARSWAIGSAAAAALLVIGLLATATIDARRDRRDATELAAVLAAPDASTVVLHGDSGTGRLTWSASEGRSVLVLDGMPAAPDGRAYALWYIMPDGPQPVGLFEDGGHKVAVIDTIPDGADAIGITEEPDTGSPQPTGPVLMLGEMT